MRMLLIGAIGILLFVSGCGSAGSTSNNSNPPPPLPNLATGQWVIVTDSTVTPGLETVVNFNLPSYQTIGNQPPILTFSNSSANITPLALIGSGNQPFPTTVTPPLGNFNGAISQCAGTYPSLPTSCPEVTLKAQIESGGVTINLSDQGPGVAQFSGTIDSTGSVMTGTYTATVASSTTNQDVQVDSGSFLATVVPQSSIDQGYAGIVSEGGFDSSTSVTISEAPTGSDTSVQGSVAFPSAANPTSLTNSNGGTFVVGGAFHTGLSNSGGLGEGVFEFIPGVSFSGTPTLDPSLDQLFVFLYVPNGNGVTPLYGFLTPDSVSTAVGNAGWAAQFTYGQGVITQVPLATFGPATPTASTSFCTVTCSTLQTTATPTTLTVSISQPVTQGYLRVFVIDTSAPAASNCTPTNQLSACSFTNYPGSGIYVGDFNPNGPVTLAGAIPAGNTIQPTDNLEVVIVNPAGSWSGTVSWQLNYQ